MKIGAELSGELVLFTGCLLGGRIETLNGVFVFNEFLDKYVGVFRTVIF